MLLRDRYTVGELAEACGIPSHMASEHLRLMQRCGFLTNEREGRKAYYRIVEMHLAGILACIESRFGGHEPERVSRGKVTSQRGRASATVRRYYGSAIVTIPPINSRRRTMSVATISPAKLAELAREGRKIELIDVRTPVEFREVHLEIARNVPLDQLDPKVLMQARNGSSSEPLYIICKSGGRGQQACEKFIKAGFANVVNVEGGTTACIAAGLPVVRGKKAISLERQVRIAAGSLVLLGVIGSLTLHPY